MLSLSEHKFDELLFIEGWVIVYEHGEVVLLEHDDGRRLLVRVRRELAGLLAAA